MRVLVKAENFSSKMIPFLGAGKNLREKTEFVKMIEDISLI